MPLFSLLFQALCSGKSQLRSGGFQKCSGKRQKFPRFLEESAGKHRIMRGLTSQEEVNKLLASPISEVLARTRQGLEVAFSTMPFPMTSTR
jgi:hypothetical protein